MFYNLIKWESPQFTVTIDTYNVANLCLLIYEQLLLFKANIALYVHAILLV